MCGGREMILIQLTDDHVDMLMKCKKARSRCFNEWKLHDLLNEAIGDFYRKYGVEGEK